MKNQHISIHYQFNINKEIHAGIILKQLQKAFGRLHHKVFLEKMTFLGFKTSVIKWFESYRLNCKFLGSVDVLFSEAGISDRCSSEVYSRSTSVFINIDLPQSSEVAVIFIFILFSVKAKTFTKMKMFWMKNSWHSVNGSLITSYQFILGKIKQSASSFLNVNVPQS